MLVSGISIFYRIRYKNQPFFKNPWTMVGIFVLNFCMFAWGAILFVATEWFRWNTRKTR